MIMLKTIIIMMFSFPIFGTIYWLGWNWGKGNFKLGGAYRPNDTASLQLLVAKNNQRIVELKHLLSLNSPHKQKLLQEFIASGYPLQ